MPKPLRVASRFCGPPGIANGGYLAGLLARDLPGAVEVRLRAPAPLDQPLELHSHPDGSRTLEHQGTELARAVPSALELEPRPAPDPADTLARAGSCRAMRTHPFPGCYVCGPAREDGLRVFPGMVAGSDAVAAVWTPGAELCDATGRVAPEFLWAVLDCPSAFPLLESEAARALEPMVLSKLCVALEGELRAGEAALVVAWPIAQDGPRGSAGAAIFGANGRIVGRARATWVSLAKRALDRDPPALVEELLPRRAQ
ncbi:MAG TPA: hypothetical protein VMR86_04400 [Myxococcota bacterium]|nr:hypothetical protein [Myxococcota bacterium]